MCVLIAYYLAPVIALIAAILNTAMSSSTNSEEMLLVSDNGFDVYCCAGKEMNKEIFISITPAVHNNKSETVNSIAFNRLMVPMPPERLFRQAQKAFHERQLEFKVQAGHITPQIASLFKAIGKTMPVAWHDQDSILVMDEVIIDKPYNSARLINKKETDDGDTTLLNRVQRLLEHERQKLFINK